MPSRSPTPYKGGFSKDQAKIRFVLENHATMSMKELSEATKVSYGAISELLRRHGLRAKQEKLNHKRANLEPLSSLSPTGWAYLAALVDGEGTITITRKKKYFQCQVIVSNTSYLLYEHLTKLGFSATIAKNGNGRLYWRLHVTGYQTDELLNGMLPFLVIKKEQAELLLRFIAIRKQQGLHDQPTQDMLAIWQRVRALNERGFKFERELAERGLTISSRSITSTTPKESLFITVTTS